MIVEAPIRSFNHPQMTKTGKIRKGAGGKPIYTTYIDLPPKYQSRVNHHMLDSLYFIKKLMKQGPNKFCQKSGVDLLQRKALKNEPYGGYGWLQRLNQLIERLQNPGKYDITMGFLASYNYIITTALQKYEDVQWQKMLVEHIESQDIKIYATKRDKAELNAELFEEVETYEDEEESLIG